MKGPAGDRLTVTIIIPTLNRPLDLSRCLTSILKQTVLPDQVVVVDDGESDVASIAARFEGTSVQFVYVKKRFRGLCRSRNEGLDHATGAIVVFLDDDTELFPEYIEGFLEVFAGDTERRIGGVSGWVARVRDGKQVPNETKRTAEWWLMRAFLLTPGQGGRMLPSGFRASLMNPRGHQPVDFLQGGNMALRREVFDEFRFDEALDRTGGYSLGEDVIFSYAVGRKWKLVAVERSKMLHYHAEGGRPDVRAMQKIRVLNQHRFLRDVLRAGPAGYLAFAWALTGLVVIPALLYLRGLRHEHVAALRGTLDGIWLLMPWSTNPLETRATE